MNIKLDKTKNTVEQPGVWLCHRNYNKICNLSPISDLKVYVAANSYDEITFTFHKENNGEIFPYWEEIKNLKVIYVENFGYFEIAVDKDDKEDTIKTITGISIEAELAQIILRNLSINGEYDLNKDENFFTENGKTSYKPTVLYNENDTSHSLLHRVLSKAPHWSVGHIDSQITENDVKVSTSAVKRKFEFDNISIYDALQEIAAELDLVFTFDTANRLVNMYDLNSIGNDTTIFVNKENLANQFTCSSNKDSIKNRFKIVGGDDIITSYVATVNPNGTQYIDFYSDDQKTDMSKELVDKLQEYDELYETNREAYQEASAALYKKIDELNYLKYTKAPVPQKISTTAEAEIQKLTSANIGSVPVPQINQLYKKGADKAVLTIAQILVDYRYTVTIESSVYDSSTQKWTGTFKVANESNPSDMAKSPNDIVLNIAEDEKEDLQNKINKIIGDVDFEDETLEELKETLKQYSLSYLETYEAMYKECTTVLLEQGYGVVTSKFYYLYKEYWQKQKACENEIALRKSEIETVEKELDSAQKAVNDYHQLLNFENFVGETLFKELSCYIREDTYENNNYISDGLSDAECIENAKKLVEAATKELYRASTFQYTYTASLNNLFHNLNFEPFYDQFDLFNWIHAEVDEKHILLRLIGVTFDFANINQIEVEFSEQVKNADGLTDIESILSQAKSMATSYSSTARQATQGSQSYSDFQTLKEEGLNSALMNIKNSNNEEVVIDSCGINCRSKDVNDEYDGCQLRITGKNMVMTDDDWETARLAIGQLSLGDNEYYGIVADVLIGDLIAGECLVISNTSGTFVVDKDGIVVKNMKLDMSNADNSNRIVIDPSLNSILSIYSGTDQVFYVDTEGNMCLIGNLYISNGSTYLKANLDDDNILEIGVNAERRINDRIVKLNDTSWTDASFIKYNNRIYTTIMDSGNYYHCKYVYNEETDEFIENTDTRIINLFTKYSGQISFIIDNKTFVTTNGYSEHSIIKFVDGIEKEPLLIKSFSKYVVNSFIGNDDKYLYFLSNEYIDSQQPWLGSNAVIVRTEIHNNESYDSIIIDGYGYSDSIYDCEIQDECVYITVKDNNSVGYIAKVSFIDMDFAILCEIPDSEGFWGNVEDCYITVHNRYMHLIGNHTYGVSGNENLNYVYDIKNNNLIVLNDLPVGIGSRYRSNNCFRFNNKIHLFSQVYGNNSYNNKILHYTLDIISEGGQEQKIFYVTNKGEGFFDGNITARSLTLGSDVNIDMSHVDGLNDTIDGVVNDLNGKIDGIVDGFGGTIDGINSDLSNVIYKGDIITETADVGNGVIKTTTKVRNNSGGYTENTTYTSADGNYILTNIGLGGDDSGHYCIISKDGLLEAENAKISGQINASQGYIGGWAIGEDGIYSIDFNISNSGIKMLSDGQILSKGTGYSEQMYARLYSGKWIFGLGDSFQTEGERYSDLSADGLYLCSTESLKNNYARYLFAVDTVNDKVSISSQSNNNALEIVNSAGNCLYLSNSRASYENAALKMRVVCSEKESELTYIKTGYISIFGEESHGRIVFRADAEGQNNTLNNFTDSAIGTTLYRWGEGYFEELTSSKALNVTSDKKKKNHISYIDKNTALNFVNALMPAMFTMKDNTNQRKHFGFYAQEVAKLAQNMNLGDLSLYNARWIKDGTDYDYSEEADDKELDWSLKYEEFIPLLTSSVQALTKHNEENEKRIESLTHTIDLLFDEIKQLKEELKEVKGLN